MVDGELVVGQDKWGEGGAERCRRNGGGQRHRVCRRKRRGSGPAGSAAGARSGLVATKNAHTRTTVVVVATAGVAAHVQALAGAPQPPRSHAAQTTAPHKSTELTAFGRESTNCPHGAFPRDTMACQWRPQ